MDFFSRLFGNNTSVCSSSNHNSVVRMDVLNTKQGQGCMYMPYKCLFRRNGTTSLQHSCANSCRETEIFTYLQIRSEERERESSMYLPGMRSNVHKNKGLLSRPLGYRTRLGCVQQLLENKVMMTSLT